MPKKNLGVNSKAVEAKARKETVRKVKEEQVAKAKEDELWRDDDKLISRKVDRKLEAEKKRMEAAARKAQNKAAAEEEAAQLAASVSSKVAKPTKVTRSQIQSTLTKAEKEAKPREPTHLEQEITENVNRIEVDGDEARNIDEAISVLRYVCGLIFVFNTNFVHLFSITETELDRHPERRLKAAYTAFEEKYLPQLKAENSNLRLSQLKQMLKKDWMKSPENPLNQRTLAFNAKS